METHKIVTEDYDSGKVLKTRELKTYSGAANTFHNECDRCERSVDNWAERDIKINQGFMVIWYINGEEHDSYSVSN